ncbi:hypothetical protein [Neorhizobium huautlense]|uniref:hypothetical protein n=1 Tax=Neorhizobium huautlense TaxID=67774 RepID=UPI000CFA7B96|nr:hypothetical protein [Neorhizobium huautlense]
MALFPQHRRIRGERDELGLVSRWPAIAVALLIAALIGLLSGVVKDVQIARGIQSAGKSTDTPHLSKREPLRALAATDRKDGTASHSANADSALTLRSTDIAFPLYSSAETPNAAATTRSFRFWPGSLPRAPPFAV